MQISLASLPRKLGFAAICLLLGCLYLDYVMRAYLASRYARGMQRADLEKAVRLEPENAEHRYLLGRYFFFVEQDFETAIEHYRAAVALNPYRAGYWLDLALAYHATGDLTEHRKSLEQAVRYEPTRPAVAWEAANFYLVQGDIPSAFRLFRVVALHESERVPAVLDLCWRTTHDADRILREALPPQAEQYIAFLGLLAARNEPAANLVWNRLLALQQPFPLQSALPYLEYLIRQKRGAQAFQAWRDLAQADTALKRYNTQGNLIVNGSFEEPVLNWGFDWRYTLNPHVAITLDSSEFRQGNRSLSISFDGQSTAEPGVYQLVSVQPATEYELSAQLKTEEILSSSGPRLVVYDAYAGTPLLVTSDRIGTSVWQPVGGSFRTGPDTDLVTVKVDRVPASGRIQGRMWLDDVRLSPRP